MPCSPRPRRKPAPLQTLRIWPLCSNTVLREHLDARYRFKLCPTCNSPITLFARLQQWATVWCALCRTRHFSTTLFAHQPQQTFICFSACVHCVKPTTGKESLRTSNGLRVRIVYSLADALLYGYAQSFLLKYTCLGLLPPANKHWVAHSSKKVTEKALSAEASEPP